MRQELERAKQESSGGSAYLLATYYFMTGNVSFMISFLGLVLIGLGATFVNGTPAIVIGGDAGIVSIMNGIPEGERTFMAVDGTVFAHKVLAGMLGIIGATFVLLGMTIYSFLFANKLYARATASA